MTTQEYRSVSFTVPIIVTMLLLQEASGVAQTTVTVIAAMAATGFVFIVAHFVWTPILRKTGLWWSTLLLGCAIVAGFLAAAVTGVKLGAPAGFAWKLSVNSAIMVLLFSWVLAALRAAQEPKSPDQPSESKPPSRLFRPGRPSPALGLSAVGRSNPSKGARLDPQSW